MATYDETLQVKTDILKKDVDATERSARTITFRTTSDATASA